jgi:type I restriction enzyme, R subunit
MSLTEAQTRKKRIDVMLGKAGWKVGDQTQVIEEFDIHVGLPDRVEEPITPYQGRQFSDYVLLGLDGKSLAVVEAKKTAVDAQLGREQAKQYCLNIQKEYKGRLPFCFYTNGLEIHFWDLGNYPPKKIIGFPTRDDLERYHFIREYKKALAQELINPGIAGRGYQIQAIRAVMESLEQKQNKFLLVMATGTGKTRVCIALVDALMRAGWIQRVLFLVDRIELRTQALDAFKEHLPNEPRWPKVGEKAISKDRRIYVSTFPTMLNIIRDEDSPLSPHFFDLVVIDESHRSIYNTYGEILSYFNTISLGLTATPTDVIDHNTFRLFNCDDGIPNFAYPYEEALNHSPPYLCDFQVMKIQTKFQEQGINKRTISLEDQKKLILEGKEVAEINFEGTQIEKQVTNRGTNALIVKEFMEECIKDPDGILPGKTIFFCSSISHARRIEKIFDSLYPEYKGELARVIISEDPRVYGKGGLLGQFKYENLPRVAVSVDMLDTGIDIQEIVNLVFAKPVYSYTKFWQMIGRGTRLLESCKIKPWCPQKDIFLIMDCWDNFEYFKLNPKGKAIQQQIPLPVRFVGIRLDKIQTALGKTEEKIALKEIEKLKVQIRGLPKNSVVITEAAQDLNRIQEENFWINLDQGKMQFLQDRIKPLFRSISQVDFKAMRFKKDVLETSLTRLEQDKNKFEILKDNLIEQISELPLSVNIVARQAQTIKEAQSKRFWVNLSDQALDELSQRLAPLMKFRQCARPLDEQASFDFKDILIAKEMVEFGPEQEAVSISAYREMVEQMILGMIKDNPILQKIKENEPVSEDEIQKLAKQLQGEHPHITEDLLKKAYQNRQARFIQFIRHILGLEVLESFPETVTKTFELFIREHTGLNLRQIEFLNLLREFVLERESIQKKDLIQSPFTIIHPQGIRGVFSPKQIEEIIILTRKFAA